jgi:hypothetical protein
MLASVPDAIGFWERIGTARWRDTLLYRREH